MTVDELTIAKGEATEVGAVIETVADTARTEENAGGAGHVPHRQIASAVIGTNIVRDRAIENVVMTESEVMADNMRQRVREAHDHVVLATAVALLRGAAGMTTKGERNSEVFPL